MKYWDSSAVVPLLLEERVSPVVKELYQRDPELLVWWGTPVECVSAISRREREGAIDLGDSVFALDRLEALSLRWHVVQPVRAIQDLACRLLRVHPLRAADSLQLAAAIAVNNGSTFRLRMVGLDDRLAQASAREGLRVTTLPAAK